MLVAFITVLQNFEALLAANDRAELILSTYNTVKKHKMSLDEAKTKLRPTASSSATSPSASSSALDIFDVFNDPSPQPSHLGKAAAPQLGIKIDAYSGEPAKASPSLIRTTPKHGEAVDDEVMGLHAFTSSPAVQRTAPPVANNVPLPAPPLVQPQPTSTSSASHTSLLEGIFSPETQTAVKSTPATTIPKISPPVTNKPTSIPILPPPPASSVRSPAPPRSKATAAQPAADHMDELLSIATRQSSTPQQGL